MGENGGVPPQSQVFKEEKINFSQKCHKDGLVSEKNEEKNEKKIFFNFFRKKGGGVNPKLKNFNFLVFLMKASLSWRSLWNVQPKLKSRKK